MAPATEPHASNHTSRSSPVRPPNASSVAIIAMFQNTPDTYERKKRPWLFRIPRLQAERANTAAPGNSTRMSRTVRSCLAPV